MNSIVERLRNPFHMHDSPTMREAADLIEQQAERIKELEAYNATRTDEMIAATRRIKELESALCEEVEARSRWYCEADKLKEELAALRQRIADAPVVAWLHEARQDSDVITNAVKHVWGGVAVGKEAKYTIPLISKEDLK